jgi:hypothetical protein
MISVREYIGRVALAGLVMVSTGVMLGVAATSAGAATTTPPVSEAINGWNYNGIWAGNYKLDDGDFPTYCITAGAAYPSGTYSGAQPVPTSINAERIAFLLYKYGSANNDDAQAAVAALVGKFFDTVNTSEKWDVLNSTQLALANQYWSQASAQAGPDTVQVNLPANVIAGTTASGTVTVLSASGTPLPSFTINLTGIGANLNNASVTTNSNGNATFTYTADPTTTGNYAIRANGTSYLSLVTYVPTGGGPIRQTVIGSGGPTVFSGQGGGAVSNPAPATTTTTTTTTTQPHPTTTTTLRQTGPPTPTTTTTIPVTTTTGAPGPAGLSTTAQTPRVKVGASVSDVVSITLPAGTSGTLTGDLYGPLPAKNGVCTNLDWTGALIAGSITPVHVSVSSVVVTSGIATNGAGCYSFAETLTLPNATLSTVPGISVETVLATNDPVLRHVHVPQVQAGGGGAPSGTNLYLAGGGLVLLLGLLGLGSTFMAGERRERN